MNKKNDWIKIKIKKETPIKFTPMDYYFKSPEQYRKILVSLALSRAVYEKSIFSVSKYKVFCETTFDEISESSGSVDVPKFWVCVSKKTKEVYITFKGTDNYQNVIQDVQIYGMSNEIDGFFHYGFYTEANKVPLTDFSKFLEDGYELIFTGHSLGAAIASITAIKLLTNGYTKNREKIYTIGFGCPLFSCKSFKEVFNDYNTNNFVYFYNEDDPVPKILSMIKSYLNQQKTKKKMDLITLFDYGRKIIQADLLSIAFDMKDILLKGIGKFIPEYTQIGNHYLLYKEETDIDTFYKILKKDVFTFGSNFFDTITQENIEMHRMSQYEKYIYKLLNNTDYEKIHFIQYSPSEKNQQLYFKASIENYQVSSFKCGNSYQISIEINGKNMEHFKKLEITSFKNPPTLKLESSNYYKIRLSYCLKNMIDHEIILTSCYNYQEETIKIAKNNIKDVPMFKGRELKIAYLQINELLSSGFAYSLFGGKRSAFYNQENFKNSKKRRDNVLNTLIGIENTYLPLLKDNKFIDTPEFKNGVEQMCAKFKSNFYQDKNDNNDIKIPIKVKSFKEIYDEYNSSEKYSSTQAVVDSFPLILFIESNLIKMNFEVDWNFSQKMALISGITILTTGVVLFPLALPLAIAGGLSVFGVGTTGFAVSSIISNKLEGDYLKLLKVIISSIEMNEEPKADISYLHEIIIKKNFDHVINSEKKTNEEIKKNWETYFPQGIINRTREKDRDYMLNTIRGVMRVGDLREDLRTDISIGVVGTGNVGKSTLIKKMYGFNTNPSTDHRTEEMTPYPLLNDVMIIDFPHFTCPKETVKGVFIANNSLLDALIIIFNSEQQVYADDEKAVIQFLSTLAESNGGTFKILFVLNKYEVILNAYYRQNKLNEKEIWTKEEIEEQKQKLKEKVEEDRKKYIKNISLAVKNDNIAISKDNVFITCFEMTYHLPFFPNKDTLEELEFYKEIGVKSPMDIMKWSHDFLQDMNIDKGPLKDYENQYENKIKEKYKSYKKAKKTVDQWLNEINLGKYIQSFKNNCYDNLELIFQHDLNDEDFQIIKIMNPMDRRIIKDSIKMNRNLKD